MSTYSRDRPDNDHGDESRNQPVFDRSCSSRVGDQLGSSLHPTGLRRLRLANVGSIPLEIVYGLGQIGIVSFTCGGRDGASFCRVPFWALNH